MKFTILKYPDKFMYDPTLAPVLDWLTVFGFITATAFVTWQVMTRSTRRK